MTSSWRKRFFRGVTSFFESLDFFREAPQFGAVDDAMVHHAGQQFFERAAAEVSQRAAHRFGRHLARLAGTGVNELPPVHLMLHVLLGLETAKHGSDGGVGQRTIFADGGAHHLAGRRPIPPEKLHHLLLQIPQAFSLRHIASP
jgi:hypothetical protein